MRWPIVPGEFRRLSGDIDAVQAIEFVDQNPIGRSSRSNPVTYVKAYDEIRKLMAAQPLAKQMDFTPAYFSFNADGGRCEECKGDGVVKVEMQFMADLVLECESCHGKRFKSDVLEVKYEGRNIYEMLEMTVNQAIEFLTEHGQKKICQPFASFTRRGFGLHQVRPIQFYPFRAVKTSVYIYLVPVITVAASVLILREPFTWMTGAGTVLTLIGLLLSEGKLHWKEGTHHETGTGQMRPGD